MSRYSRALVTLAPTLILFSGAVLLYVRTVDHIVTGRRHACVRVNRNRVITAYRMHMVVDAATISVAIAAAGPISPASSRLRIASDASWVSGAYRNTTAEMVTIALTKR